MGDSPHTARAPRALTESLRRDPRLLSTEEPQGLGLADQVWFVKRQNRALQEELEQLMDLEQKLEGYDAAAREHADLLRRSEELRQEEEDFRRRLHPSATESLDTERLRRHMEQGREEIQLARSVIEDLHEEQGRLRKSADERLYRMQEEERRRAAHDTALRREGEELRAAVRQLSERTLEIEQELQLLAPMEKLYSMVRNITTEKQEDTVPLQRYEALQREVAAMRQQSVDLL
eukprot:Hpha_TRINITY_DN23476_c0_g1::TRINITY_DN23476_c0_g1_i1::g.114095::m.114095